ncbi:hypothetical protein Tco_1099646, partial [Tanacetum coccineum]
MSSSCDDSGKDGRSAENSCISKPPRSTATALIPDLLTSAYSAEGTNMSALKDGLAAIEKAEKSKRIGGYSLIITPESKAVDNDRFKVVAIFTGNNGDGCNIQKMNVKRRDTSHRFSFRQQ